MIDPADKAERDIIRAMEGFIGTAEEPNCSGPMLDALLGRSGDARRQAVITDVVNASELNRALAAIFRATPADTIPTCLEENSKDLAEAKQSKKIAYLAARVFLKEVYVAAVGSLMTEVERQRVVDAVNKITVDDPFAKAALATRSAAAKAVKEEDTLRKSFVGSRETRAPRNSGTRADGPSAANPCSVCASPTHWKSTCPTHLAKARSEHQRLMEERNARKRGGAAGVAYTQQARGCCSEEEHHTEEVPEQPQQQAQQQHRSNGNNSVCNKIQKCRGEIHSHPRRATKVKSNKKTCKPTRKNVKEDMLVGVAGEATLEKQAAAARARLWSLSVTPDTIIMCRSRMNVMERILEALNEVRRSKHNLPPFQWSADLFVIFLDILKQEGFASTTAEGYRSAMRWHQFYRGEETWADTPFLLQLCKAFKYDGGKAKAAPVRGAIDETLFPDLLEHMIQGHAPTSMQEAVRIAFATRLRISHLIRLTPGDVQKGGTALEVPNKGYRMGTMATQKGRVLVPILDAEVRQNRSVLLSLPQLLQLEDAGGKKDHATRRDEEAPPSVRLPTERNSKKRSNFPVAARRASSSAEDDQE